MTIESQNRVSPDLSLAGHYYDGTTSRIHRATVSLVGERLCVELLDDANEESCLFFAVVGVTISSRLANTPRAIRFPGGAQFETMDNVGVDHLRVLLGHGRSTPHILESSLPIALGALLGLVVIGAVGYHWGIPILARRIAQSVPDDMAFQMGQGSLEMLDTMMFDESELALERQAALRAGFDKMAAHYPELPLHLEFRKASMPNAFALPDGTVVVTDQLEEAADADDEIYAVLAHEIGHVEHRHALRLALESSAVGLLVMVVFGDASQAAGVAASLPAVYANSSFSRQHETEADSFALSYMKQVGMDPGAFARALEHLSQDVPEDTGEQNVLSYLASHPSTAERIARFRSAASAR